MKKEYSCKLYKNILEDENQRPAEHRKRYYKIQKSNGKVTQ